MRRNGILRRATLLVSLMALVAAGCGAEPAATTSSSSSAEVGNAESTTAPQPVELVFDHPVLVGTLSGHVADVAVTESGIVAVGNGVVVDSGEQDYVLVVYRRNDDGSWSERLDPVPSPGLVVMTDIVAAESELIAVGYGWNQDLGSTAGRMWSSEDGTTWSEVESTPFSGVELLTDVEATDAGLRLVGQSAGQPPAMWESGDGEEWRRIETAGGGSNMVAVATREGQFIGVGSDSQVATTWTSPDGGSWELAWTDSSPRSHMHDVARIGDWFVAVGYTGAIPGERLPAVWVSRDGIGWQRSDIQQPGAEFYGLAEHGDGLIVVGAVHQVQSECQPCPATWETAAP